MATAHRHSPCDGCSNAQEFAQRRQTGWGTAQLSGARSATARLPWLLSRSLWLALPLRQPACRAPAQVSPLPAVRPVRGAVNFRNNNAPPPANRIGQSTRSATSHRWPTRLPRSTLPLLAQRCAGGSGHTADDAAHGVPHAPARRCSRRSLPSPFAPRFRLSRRPHS